MLVRSELGLREGREVAVLLGAVLDAVDNIVHHLAQLRVLRPAQVAAGAHKEETRDGALDPVRRACEW